jgi:hypothetical protein
MEKYYKKIPDPAADATNYKTNNYGVNTLCSHYKIMIFDLISP